MVVVVVVVVVVVGVVVVVVVVVMVVVVVVVGASVDVVFEKTFNYTKTAFLVCLSGGCRGLLIN